MTKKNICLNKSNKNNKTFVQIKTNKHKNKQSQTKTTKHLFK